MASTRLLILDWETYTKDPEIHTALLTWARRHGIDPNDAVGTQIVEVDDDARQIHVEVYARDEEGQIAIVGGEAITELRCIQLEAPALALPDLTSRSAGAQ
jgi:hypothetical protein